MNKFLYVVSATVLMVGFQNCAKTTFSSSGSSTYLAALDGDTPGAGTAGDKTPPGDTTTDTSVPPKDHGNCVGHDHDTVSSHDHDSSSDDQDSDFYLCVLQDHGKSLKLGLVQDALDGVNAVANVVCVSKAECLGDVAEHFKVETNSYMRGFCEHNPNVAQLTDAEVKKLLGVN